VNLQETASFERRGTPRHTFTLAEGDTDRAAVHEVWDRNGYGIDARQMRGPVIDIGANVGAFTVLASKLGAPEVHAYEPHPASFAALSVNVANLKGIVRVTEAAVVGKVPDHAPVLVRDGGAAGLGGGTAIPRFGDGTHEVAAVTVADMMDAATLAGKRHVSLMKIDCEGCEVDVIAAMTAAHLGLVDRIIMEFHGPAMPHLDYLDVNDVLPPMVMRLAHYGPVNVNGRPTHGGYLRWTRFGITWR